MRLGLRAARSPPWLCFRRVPQPRRSQAGVGRDAASVLHLHPSRRRGGEPGRSARAPPPPRPASPLPRDDDTEWPQAGLGRAAQRGLLGAHVPRQGPLHQQPAPAECIQRPHQQRDERGQRECTGRAVFKVRSRREGEAAGGQELRLHPLCQQGRRRGRAAGPDQERQHKRPCPGRLPYQDPVVKAAAKGHRRHSGGRRATSVRDAGRRRRRAPPPSPRRAWRRRWRRRLPRAPSSS